MERTGTTGANGPAHPEEGNVIHFPSEVIAAKKAQLEAATEAWAAFVVAYRNSLTVGSVSAMRTTVEAHQKFEDLSKGI